MLAWSPGTNGKPVVAEAIVLPKFRDSTEFVRWLPQARGKIVLLSPAWPTCRPSEDWVKWATPASRARMDTTVAVTLREWSVINGADGKPDSSKLYRGTGYSLALGTGTLGMRLEKAAVVARRTPRPKLQLFNPFTADASVAGGRGVETRQGPPRGHTIGEPGAEAPTPRESPS